jgi:mannose-6-phosphate isomerase-like protein (cupin superfamily)
MFRAGDVIENPVTGERIAFRRTAAESNGEVTVVETWVRPGGFVAAAHVHPAQEETFSVCSGTLAFRVGGETVEVGAGGQVVVRAGTPHKFWNAGGDDAHFVCEVRPSLQFEALLGAMFTLAASGKTNRKGMPNAFRLAVIAQACFDTVRLPFPPAFVQRLGLALAAPIGRLLGYSASYVKQHEAPLVLDPVAARPPGFAAIAGAVPRRELTPAS